MTRVYQFLPPEFGLKAIRSRRLKISRIHELNDPFEFLGVELSDAEFRTALRATKRQLSEKNGLLCFSKDWRSPVLWAHYADRHRGLCLGFDMPRKFLKQVTYVNARFETPKTLNEAFVKRLLFTKFTHWSYEDEYRAYVTLDESENGLYFKDFSDDLCLKQVLVGAESQINPHDLTNALGEAPITIEMFKVRPAFKSFRMVRQRREDLWA